MAAVERGLKITIPGATPELCAKAEKAALDFFAAVGTTPYLAAHAHWRCEGLIEFDCAEFGTEEDVKAANAWEHIDNVVAEAIGVPWAFVELAGPSEQAAGATELGQRSVGAQRVGLVEDLSGLELEQRPGVPF